MKNITAMMITLAMLLSMTACNEGTNTPANTTAGTTVTTAETTTAAETTEVTASAEVTSENISDITPLLEGMPVYDIHYVPGAFLEEFENVCGEKMAEYIDGDPVMLFACRFVEHPDIAIIGHVKSNEYGTAYRGIDSVIRNGERYYTPEYDSGPGFEAYITDGFIAIDSSASFTGMAYFVYDGGIEYHKYPDDLKNSFPYFTLEDGVMKYNCVSEQYASATSQCAIDFYLNYTGKDDYYGSSGTVRLVDGKIEYVEESSNTLEEWYADHPYRNKYGETLDEFLESIRVLYDLEKEDLGKNWRN